MQLTIGSYNSQGMGIGRVEYINEMLNEVDFLCLQEHWLFDEQIHNFARKFNNTCVWRVWNERN